MCLDNMKFYHIPLLTLGIFVSFFPSVFSAPVLPDPDPRSVPKASALSAQKQCGADRRCRLARLKKLNQARRLSRQKGIDFQALTYIKNTDARHQSSIPRQSRVWGIDLSSFYLGYGFTGRYSLSPRWQVNLSYNWVPIESEVMLISRAINVQSLDPLPFFDASLLYFNRLKMLSTYMGLSLRYGKGEMYVSDTNAVASGGLIDGLLGSIGGGNGGEYASEQGEGEFHMIGLSGGLDYQSATGFHARLGLTYHFPLFVSHRQSDTGQNFSMTKGSLNTWASTVLSFGYDFSLGWTF